MGEGLKLASELGSEHRFLVYNGSVHAYNIARPLLTISGGASELAGVFQAVCKALEGAEEADVAWRVKLGMEQARCLERAGRKKEAPPILLALAPLAAKCGEGVVEELLRMQAHVAADDPAALKKLRDESEKLPRRKGVLTAQWLADGAPPDPRGEVRAAIAALDPELSAAMEVEGGEEGVARAVAMLKGRCEDDDLLLSIASQERMTQPLPPHLLLLLSSHIHSPL